MSVLHAVGHVWAKWRLSRRDLFTVEVRAALRGGGRALVCLPTDIRHVAEGAVVAGRFQEWFSPVNALWLGSGGTEPDTPNAPLPITAIPNAVNRWGLPHKPVVQQIQRLKPRVAIDLNPRFQQASAYLCVLSGAELRVGFDAPRDGYFNLQYGWPDGGEASLAEHYERFLEMLTDLRSTGE